MQKKSLLASAVLAVALLGSSSAFAADSTNHGKLSAFQNIQTSDVSASEITQVSGEYYNFVYVAAARVLPYVPAAYTIASKAVNNYVNSGGIPITDRIKAVYNAYKRW